MKNKNLFTKIVFIGLIVLLVFSLLAPAIFSQASAGKDPRREQLLNGLRVYLFNDPAADKTIVKVRIHSGSAFDPQGKEGLMALLAANIFPDPAAGEFFEEDLGGSLQVTSGYDHIQVAASSRPEDFLRMLETVSTAVSAPTVDKETTAALKARQLEALSRLEKDPAYIADRAVAHHLLGTFPYGRPGVGTAESLARIDFADLIDVRGRFLTADNATVAIAGKFDHKLALQAVKRYFGAWIKSDKKIPSTFRQPDLPPADIMVVESPVADTSEFRFALRGLARNDAKYHAAEILERVLSTRLSARGGSVSHESHVLPGIFVFSLPNWEKDGITKAENKIVVPLADGYQSSFLKDRVTAEEFAAARRDYLAEAGRYDIVDLWLDADTYGIKSPKADIEARSAVTVADAQSLLTSLQKAPVAFALVYAPAPAAQADKGSSEN